MKMVAHFPFFSDGIAELVKSSSAAHAAIKHNMPQGASWPPTEEEAVAALALNVYYDAHSGNGYGWGTCSLELGPMRVEYETGGGTRFGWSVDSSDFQPMREIEKDYDAQNSNAWTFWVTNSASFEKEANGEHSTLLSSLRENGWIEETD